MSVHEEIREQRKKLKGQGFKVHWDYFWEYYKIHVVVAITVIILISVLIHDIAAAKPTGFYAMVINSSASFSQEDVEKSFEEYSQMDTSSYECNIDMSSSYNPQTVDQMTMVTVQKIMANISAGELDVIMGDTSAFYYYANMQTFIDLTTVLSEEQLSKYSDQLVYVDQSFLDYLDSDAYQTFLSTGEYDKDNHYAAMAAEQYKTGVYPDVPIENMDKPIPVGIRVDQTTSKVLSGAHAYEATDAPIIGIIQTTQRTDMCLKFIEFMLEQ